MCKPAERYRKSSAPVTDSDTRNYIKFVFEVELKIKLTSNTPHAKKQKKKIGK